MDKNKKKKKKKRTGNDEDRTRDHQIFSLVRYHCATLPVD
jgi:hypothetical protein